MKTFLIKNFGCKVSQYEGEKIRDRVLSKGWQLATNPDLIIINGCAVTKKAETKAIRFIKSQIKEFPFTRFMVTGCLAKMIDDQKMDIGIDHIILPSQINLIESILDSFQFRNELSNNVNDLISFNRRSRPLIKIHDGCNQYCSYCIVPYLRGDERSYSPQSIIDNINTYVENDYFEIVITGIHIGKYHYEDFNLARLLKKICEETSIKRIRLSSIEPIEFTDELLEYVASENRIADYYHIPLQSGSDSVLHRMNRPYRSEVFTDVINKISSTIPNAGIGTDIIAGFPGESDDEFEETFTLVNNLPLSNMHVFPYSVRPGTEAAEMPNQIPNVVKKERIKRLRDIRLNKKHDFYKRYIGQEQKYLIDQFNSQKGEFSGTSSNYIQCKSTNPTLKIGEEFLLTGENIEGEYLICR